MVFPIAWQLPVAISYHSSCLSQHCSIQCTAHSSQSCQAACKQSLEAKRRKCRISQFFPVQLYRPLEFLFAVAAFTTLVENFLPQLIALPKVSALTAPATTLACSQWSHSSAVTPDADKVADYSVCCWGSKVMPSMPVLFSDHLWPELFCMPFAKAMRQQNNDGTDQEHSSSSLEDIMYDTTGVTVSNCRRSYKTL